MNSPQSITVINEGFELLSKRIEAIGERADRNIEGLSTRMVELNTKQADIGADLKIVLQQVRLTNGTVSRHEDRITAMERTAADLAHKSEVTAIKEQIHDVATKRVLMTNQVKVLWGVVTLGLAAYFARLFK